jgi:hypothetical protein
LRETLGLTALITAVTAGAVASLVGLLTKSVAVALLVVLIGVAALAFLSRRATPPIQSRQRLGLLLLSLAAAVGACGVAAYSFYDLTTQEQRVAEDKLTEEERLVASLSAGMDFSNFREAFGNPDTKRTDGDYDIYQYERQWETLQAVANSSGEVVSYAVYAKVTDFHPKFNHGTHVVLNQTTLGEASATSLMIGANAYCGAHKAGYFEAFGGSEAEDARYFVVGVSDANTTEIPGTAEVCTALFEDEQLGVCLPFSGNELTAKGMRCVETSSEPDRFSSLKASVYIETAPYVEILPVMLYPPDEAAVL